MPKVPFQSETALRTPGIRGATTPARISPGVANEIGQAGRAWNAALSNLGNAAASVAQRSAQTESAQAYGQAQLEALQRSTEAYDDAVLTAGVDGAGLESFPQTSSSIFTDVLGKYEPKLTPEAKAKLQLDFAERNWRLGRKAIETYQTRKKDYFQGQIGNAATTVERHVLGHPHNADEALQALYDQIEGAKGRVLTAPEADELRRKTTARVRTAQIRALIQQDPDAAAQFFSAIREQVPDDVEPGTGRLSDTREGRPRTSGKPVKRFSGGVNRAINKAARETGLDPQLIGTFVRIESGGDPKLVSSGGKGSYKGALQLSEGEFKKFGGGNIFDAEDNVLAGAKKLKAEAARFRRRHDRAPTALDLYLVHQQGEAGYSAHLGNPSGVAWRNIRRYYTDAAARSRGFKDGDDYARAAIWDNVPDDVKGRFDGVEDVSSAEFIQVWREKVQRFGGGQAVSADAPQALKLKDITINSRKAGEITIPAEDLNTIAFGQLMDVLKSQRKEMVSSAKDRADELIAQVEQGIAVDRTKVAQVEAVATGIGADDTTLQKKLRKLRASNSVMEGLRGAPATAVDNQIAQLEQRVRANPTPEGIETLDAAREFQREFKSQIKSDPLGLANAQGVIELSPITMQNLPDSLSQRRQDANRVAAIYGTRPVFFQPAERDAFITAIDNGSAEQKLALVETMRGAFGVQTPKVMRELDGAPVFAHLGGLSLTSPHHRKTALEGFQGLDTMKTAKDAKLESFVPMKEVGEVYTSNYQRLFGAGTTDTQDMLFRSAQAIAVQRLTENPSLDRDDVIQESLQAAAGRVKVGNEHRGGIVDYNGQPVVIPASMTEDDFTTTLAQIGESLEAFEGGEIEAGTALDSLHRLSGLGGEPVIAFSGKRLHTRDWDDVRLVSVGNGLYQVYVGEPGEEGTILVQDSDAARPFILDLNKAESALSMLRTPQAETNPRARPGANPYWSGQ